MTKISQVEARQLRKRVRELESMERNRRVRYARDYPGGVHVASLSYESGKDFLPAVVTTSRQLGHAVVVVADGGSLRFYAIPHPDQPV